MPSLKYLKGIRGTGLISGGKIHLIRGKKRSYSSGAAVGAAMMGSGLSEPEQEYNTNLKKLTNDLRQITLRDKPKSSNLSKRTEQTGRRYINF
jgi:hypothetical protein